MTLNFGNNLFPPQREILTNYDWIDIASGTGFVKFYGATTINSTGESQFLTTSILRSAIIEKGGTGAAQQTLVETYNFNLSQFNRPQIIEGTANVIMSLHHARGDSGAEGTITINIIKVVEGTPTTLVSIVSETYTENSTENLVLLPVIPKTHFAIGNILRIQVIASHTNGANGGSKMIIGNDPINRDGTELTPTTEDVTTQMKIEIPFRINL